MSDEINSHSSQSLYCWGGHSTSAVYNVSLSRNWRKQSPLQQLRHNLGFRLFFQTTIPLCHPVIAATACFLFRIVNNRSFCLRILCFVFPFFKRKVYRTCWCDALSLVGELNSFLSEPMFTESLLISCF